MNVWMRHDVQLMRDLLANALVHLGLFFDFLRIDHDGKQN